MEGKRVRRIESKFQPKKCAKRHFDRISRLPDDILVDILSFLPLKEAARTSVLSSRWINLWKHTPSLNFDTQSALEKINTQYAIWLELIESEGCKYVEWVNSVLQSHKSPTLKEFRIHFSLDRKAESSITRWLQFAFADRQVQRFELNLDNYSSCSDYYCFPKELFSLSSCTSPKLLHNFNSVKELSFQCVRFARGDVEFFLRNCPLLERLVVRLSGYLSAIEVCGPSLKLKHLEIVNCQDFKSLKIYAPNLTSLSVTMSKSRFGGLLLEHVPMLVELSVPCGNDICRNQLISAFSCCISRLEVLCLTLLDREETDELYKFPKMPKLKKLVIEYLVCKSRKSLVRLTALVRASPHIEEFVVKYKWYKLVGADREAKDPIRSPHLHLKVFKFGGYYCHNTDVELLSYILENGVVLEKIIIDCTNRSPGSHGIDAEQTARNYAKQQLEPRVPQHIELVII